MAVILRDGFFTFKGLVKVRSPATVRKAAERRIQLDSASRAKARLRHGDDQAGGAELDEHGELGTEALAAKNVKPVVSGAQGLVLGVIDPTVACRVGRDGALNVCGARA